MGFNEREMEYPGRLFPLLDVEGEGSISYQALCKVIESARQKGFKCEDGVAEEMFTTFARENGDTLTENDLLQIVSESKMHYKK